MSTIESNALAAPRVVLATLMLTSLAALGCDSSAATVELDYYVYEQDVAAAGTRGAPIAGVLVALDLPGGRQNLTTDATGRVHLSIPDDAPDFTLTSAKPGLLPVATLYRVTVAEAQAEIAKNGQLYSVMSAPPPAPITDVVTLTVTSTSRFCVSTAVSDWCPLGGSATPTVPRSAEPLTLVAHSFDLDGCAERLLEVTLPDTLTDQTVPLDFSTAAASPPRRVDLSLRMPTDPESVLRTAGPYTGSRFPLLVVDAAADRIRGGACAEALSTDGNTLSMSARWFPPATGEPSFAIIVFPDVPAPHDGDEMQFSYLQPDGELGDGPYDILDIPRVTSNGGAAPTLASTFETQQVAGASAYDLAVHDGRRHGVALWSARSFRHQPVTLPALPAGYDRTVDWPADGRVVVRAAASNGVYPYYVPSYDTPGVSQALSTLTNATVD